MKTYRVPNLTATTTEADQTKLVTALKAVKGVENAVLHPAQHEFEIRARDKEEPKRDEIAAAASKAGFALASKLP